MQNYTEIVYDDPIYVLSTAPIKVKIKKNNPSAKIPTRGSDYSAGYDLYACNDEVVVVPPHQTVKLNTGLSIVPPSGYFGAIFARSGIATKRGLRPSNCCGICDEDYRGDYIVALHNDTGVEQIIAPHERIAQLVFLPYLSVDFDEVETLEETERGSGGFGSTGEN